MWRRLGRPSAREIAKRVWEDILKTPEIEPPETPESAARHAPEMGVYEGASPFVYWRVLSFTTLLVVVVVAALLWVLQSDLIGEHSASPTALSGMAIFLVTMGLIIIVGVLRDTLPVARLVRWSPDGIEVQWYLGPCRSFRWQEVQTLTLSQTPRGFLANILPPRVARVTTTSGSLFEVDLEGATEAGLTAALQAHISPQGKMT